LSEVFTEKILDLVLSFGSLADEVLVKCINLFLFFIGIIVDEEGFEVFAIEIDYSLAHSFFKFLGHILLQTWMNHLFFLMFWFLDIQ
jgi:hypothetical protein